MAYQSMTFIDGETPLNAENMNNIIAGVDEAKSEKINGSRITDGSITSDKVDNSVITYTDVGNRGYLATVNVGDHTVTIDDTTYINISYFNQFAFEVVNKGKIEMTSFYTNADIIDGNSGVVLTKGNSYKLTIIDTGTLIALYQIFENIKTGEKYVRIGTHANSTWSWNGLEKLTASSSSTGGSVDSVLYVEQTLTDAQKTIARENIGAADADTVADHEGRLDELGSALDTTDKNVTYVRDQVVSNSEMIDILSANTNELTGDVERLKLSNNFDNLSIALDADGKIIWYETGTTDYSEEGYFTNVAPNAVEIVLGKNVLTIGAQTLIGHENIIFVKVFSETLQQELQADILDCINSGGLNIKNDISVEYSPIYDYSYALLNTIEQLRNEVSDTYISKNQGPENAGKILIVDTDGNLVLKDI